MVLGELPVPGRPTLWMKVGQGPTALAEGAGGGCLDIFTLVCLFYRLKYCLKGPLNQKQLTNHKAPPSSAPSPRPVMYFLRSRGYVPGGGRVVRWCWVNFQCRGVLQLDYSRARAYCTCSRCGWVLFGHFYSHLSFLFSFSLSLGVGPIKTEILSQRSVEPKTTKQPTNHTFQCGTSVVVPECYMYMLLCSCVYGPQHYDQLSKMLAVLFCIVI